MAAVVNTLRCRSNWSKVLPFSPFNSLRFFHLLNSVNTLNKGSPLLKNLVDLYNSPRLKKVKTLRVHVIVLFPRITE